MEGFGRPAHQATTLALRPKPPLVAGADGGRAFVVFQNPGRGPRFSFPCSPATTRWAEARRIPFQDGDRCASDATMVETAQKEIACEKRDILPRRYFRSWSARSASSVPFSTAVARAVRRAEHLRHKIDIDQTAHPFFKLNRPRFLGELVSMRARRWSISGAFFRQPLP